MKENKEERVIKIKEMNLNNTLYSRYKMEVPSGALFYPCCGSDLFEPLQLFIDTISEYHFVDMFPSPLPLFERDFQLVTRNGRIPKTIEVIPASIVDRVQRNRIEEKVIDKSILAKLEEINVKSVGYENINTKTRKTILTYTPNEDRKIEINTLGQDGLVQFMSLDSIAVFFLRGDSLGEGGSGQVWFQPKIFDLILEKLLDGGYIVTDGSGMYGHAGSQSDYYDMEKLPWKPLWENQRLFREQDSQLIKEFNYKNRTFNFIGWSGYEHRTVFIWKVTKN